MSKRFGSIVLAVIALSACTDTPIVPPFSPDGAQYAKSGSGTTGQGIMVNMVAEGTYTSEVNETYRFNKTAAVAYFTNAMIGGPEITCSGSAANCAALNQPATPTAPAPDAKQLAGNNANDNTGTAAAQACTFFSGGTLTDGAPYTQSVTVNGLNGRGNWTFTWTYQVTANPDTKDVVAHTAWDLIDSNGGGTPHVDIAGEIAGLSAVVQRGQTLPKYSFSLLQDDGLTSRVQNTVLTVDGVANDITTTYEQNCAGCLFGDPGALDFAYVTNAGSNGNIALLQDGDARTLLNTDPFAGNNNGGSDGAALAHAVFTFGQDFESGDHTVVFTGTVKGNSALADQTFTISQTVHVIAPGCMPQ